MTNMTTPPTNDDEDDAGDDESLMELKTGVTGSGMKPAINE